MKKQLYIEINKEQLNAFLKLPMDKPIVMMNLLKFKETVSGKDITGADLYKKYMKAATPFFVKANAEILFIGKPLSVLIGPEKEVLWDKLLLIKYKTISDFLSMVQAEGYPAHLREEALLDSRLIPCEN